MARRVGGRGIEDILGFSGELGDANPTCPTGQVFASWLARCISYVPSAWPVSSPWGPPRRALDDRFGRGQVPASMLKATGDAPPNNGTFVPLLPAVSAVNIAAELNKPPTNETIAAWQRTIDHYRTLSDHPGDVYDQTAARVENGDAPFAYFTTTEPNIATEDSRWSLSPSLWEKYLKRTPTSGDYAVVVYKNPLILIGDVVGVPPSLLEWIAFAFPFVGLTYLIIDNVVWPILESLWDDIKGMACNALGAAAAAGAATAAGASPELGVAALTFACGGSIPGVDGGGVVRRDDSTAIWVAAGAGAALLALLGVVAFKKRKG